MPRKKKHGMSYTRLYVIYKDIKRRCCSPNDKRPSGYLKYGAVGVRLCEEWISDKTSFFKWALLNGYDENLSIDRKDSFGDYSPENCRWVNRTTQSRNTPKFKKGISGVRGVSFCTTTNRWRATISINNKSITIGRADTIEQCLKLRNDYIDKNGLDHIKSELPK